MFAYTDGKYCTARPLPNSPLRDKPKLKLCSLETRHFNANQNFLSWRSHGFLFFTFRIINAEIVHEIQYLPRKPASSGIILNSFLCILLLFFLLLNNPSSPRHRSNGDQVSILWREFLGSSSRHACKLGRAIFHSEFFCEEIPAQPSLFALLEISEIPIWIWGKDFLGFGWIADFWS
ncbi:hypothetical protein CDAR_177741 [Caerostris darwini]|uniref:Uncharacterized protein n=1 Tax=Caerostris darwini TaxID=1538125 RepID=A0AAV4WYP2_9ARAC|nr:hypothetical protein CDAR_177741 [Caerostris darwini]